MEPRALFRYQVRETPPRATVGGVLRHQLGASRVLIRRLKAADGIVLNGRRVHLDQPAQEGDTLELVLPETATEKVDPEPVPLDFVHVDEDLIALDKPADMVVHPTHGCHHGTLANGLAYWLQQHGEPIRIHPVHRIDRDTSGLVVFARHPYAHQQLADQLEEFKLDREYIAVVEGLVTPDEGEVKAPIARRPGPGGYREVASHGQHAVTRFRVLARNPERCETLLSLVLETGRTHQIRVHMAHIGHPLLADKLYGHPHPDLGRQALHAHTLRLRHPRSRELMALVAPLPPDLRDYVARVFPGAAGEL